jgi:hypothetical protein
MHEQRLWRLVPNAQTGGDRIRDLAVGLDGHHCVACIAALLGKVREQLIERFGAHTTRIAVFEKQ